MNLKISLNITLLFFLILLGNSIVAQNVNVTSAPDRSIEALILKMKSEGKNIEFLENFKTQFKEDDRIRILRETDETYEFIVTHKGKAGMSGGAEAYVMNKKTGTYEMSWHEHPMEIPEVKEYIPE